MVKIKKIPSKFFIISLLFLELLLILAVRIFGVKKTHLPLAKMGMFEARADVPNTTDGGTTDGGTTDATTGCGNGDPCGCSSAGDCY